MKTMAEMGEKLKVAEKPAFALRGTVLHALLELSKGKPNSSFVRISVVQKIEEMLGISEEDFGKYVSGDLKLRGWVGNCLYYFRHKGLVVSPSPRRFSLTKEGHQKAEANKSSFSFQKSKPPKTLKKKEMPNLKTLTSSDLIEKETFLSLVKRASEEVKEDRFLEADTVGDYLRSFVSRVKGKVEPWGQTELITPGRAAELLETNSINRNLRKSRLDRYIKDMKNGQWKNTGQGIILSVKLPDGSRRLLNGQHTLEAILATEEALEILVVYDVPLENFPFLDQGKERDLSDILSAAGLSYSRELSAMFGKVTEIKEARGKIPDYVGVRCFRIPRTRPEFKRAIKWANENYPECRAAMRLVPNGSFAAPVSTFRALYFLFSKVDQELAENFFRTLINGYGYEGEIEENPIYRLRMSLEHLRLKSQRVRGNRISMAEQVGMTIKAWNAWRKGRVYKNIMFRSNEKIPEIDGFENPK